MDRHVRVSLSTVALSAAVACTALGQNAPLLPWCDGIQASVDGNERSCVESGSGEASFKDCAECPEMVLVPAGVFKMGSNEHSDEQPVRKVTIGWPFAVGRFEVTFAEWDVCVEEGGCKYQPADRGWGRGRQPVTNVSWDDITGSYLPWLRRKTAKSYRLPTETEWEYAARGLAQASRVSTPYPWGDDIGKGRANCSGCGSTWDNRPAPVGSFAANAFGLHDMHGNVWEWVQDCYKVTYSGAPADGQATSDVAACLRVVRGGAWYDKPHGIRSAARSGVRPVNRYGGSGFRVVRDP